MENAQLKEIFSAEDIAARVKEMGEEISKDYEGKPLVVVCVLKGAFMFFSDLVKHITVQPEIDFVRCASYGDGTSSSGTISFTKDVEVSLEDKHVLIVEDIVDTGNTIDFLVKQLQARGAASVRLAAIVDKHERRELSINVDYPGFKLHKGFIVGYGMDYAEKYRELDAIYDVVNP